MNHYYKVRYNVIVLKYIFSEHELSTSKAQYKQSSVRCVIVLKYIFSEQELSTSKAQYKQSSVRGAQYEQSSVQAKFSTLCYCIEIYFK